MAADSLVRRTHHLKYKGGGRDSPKAVRSGTDRPRSGRWSLVRFAFSPSLSSTTPPCVTVSPTTIVVVAHIMLFPKHDPAPEGYFGEVARQCG